MASLRVGRLIPRAGYSVVGIGSAVWAGYTVKKALRDGHSDEAQAARKVGAAAKAYTQAVCGGLAGGVARISVAPLDVIKIRLQLQQESMRTGHYRGIVSAAGKIAKEEGLRGLWRGTIPGLLLWIPYSAIQFAALGQANRAAEKLGFAPDDARVALASGALAAALATVFSYPLDLLRTILAGQGDPPKYPGLLAAARGVFASRGYAGLFAGCRATLLEIVPNGAVQFGSYSALRTVCRRANGGDAELRGWQGYACGFASGALGKLAVHPLDVVKKRMQMQGVPRPVRYGKPVQLNAYRGLLDCIAKLFRQEGFRGFFKGALPNIAKAAPASAVTFGSYELLIRAWSSLAASLERPSQPAS